MSDEKISKPSCFFFGIAAGSLALTLYCEYFYGYNRLTFQTYTTKEGKELAYVLRGKDTAYFAGVGNGKYISMKKYEKNARDSLRSALKTESKQKLDSLCKAQTNFQRSLYWQAKFIGKK